MVPPSLFTRAGSNEITSRGKWYVKCTELSQYCCPLLVTWTMWAAGTACGADVHSIREASTNLGTVNASDCDPKRHRSEAK